MAPSAKVTPPLDEVTRPRRKRLFQNVTCPVSSASPIEANIPVNGLTTTRPSAVVSKRYSGFLRTSESSAGSRTGFANVSTIGGGASS
jgi:hypothetical protein